MIAEVLADVRAPLGDRPRLVGALERSARELSALAEELESAFGGDGPREAE